MTDTGLVTLDSPHGFAVTVARLEGVLEDRGLTVFARIDHAVGARAAGLALRPTLVIILGDARGGTPLMQALPTLGLDLPLRMLVWEDDAGRVRLAWRDPRGVVEAHGGSAGETAGAGALAQGLSSIAAAAVGDAPLKSPLAGAARAHDKAEGVVQTQLGVGGQSFFADEPVGVGGGAGPSPHDLLAAGLGACTVMTLRLYADRKAWPLERVRVAVDHVREVDAAPPDLFRRRIDLTGPLDAAQKERLMEVAERCPVHRTLTTGARIETQAALPPEPAA